MMTFFFTTAPRCSEWLQPRCRPRSWRMTTFFTAGPKADAEPGLEATRDFGPPKGATSNGVHAVIVEIDPDTCDLKIQKIRRRSRLWHAHQPAHCRRSGAGWGGPGDRQRIL